MASVAWEGSYVRPVAAQWPMVLLREQLAVRRLAHCCTIFLKSSGYRNIDDRHRNPNIHIKEIIWLGNQLCAATPADCCQGSWDDCAGVEAEALPLLKMNGDLTTMEVSREEVLTMSDDGCCWGTDCPTGCCPEKDWFCCAWLQDSEPNACAPDAAGCP